jgi:mannose-6-phosphate isomerase-like protein (cupin superfamily)
MRGFATRPLPEAPDALAPDGSEVRLLCSLAGGSMAHFRLPPGACSTAVVHRTVGELWFVVAGEGELWRSREGVVETVELWPGVSVSIPVGTSFQFRATASSEVAVIGVTMPPWPGDDEAVAVPGAWAAQTGATSSPTRTTPGSTTVA